MGKKHKHPEHENHERWLVSYADFITLLFATFTALYAISSADLAKLKEFSQAVSQGFNQQSLMSGIKSILQGKSPPNDNPNPLSSEKGQGEGVIGKHESLTYMEGDVPTEDEQTVVNKLQKEIKKLNDKISEEREKVKRAQRGKGSQGGDEQGKGHPPTASKAMEQAPPRDIQLTMTERGMKISIDSSLLFDSGSAALKPEARETLDQISARLRELPSKYFVKVEGHTDNQPIFTAIYPSNWELSAARAGSVVRHLITKHGFDFRRMSVVGYADSRPLDANLTAAGRSRNRRIDIVIYDELREVGPSAGGKAEAKDPPLKKTVKTGPEKRGNDDFGEVIHIDSSDSSGHSGGSSDVKATLKVTSPAIKPLDLGKFDPHASSAKKTSSHAKAESGDKSHEGH